MLNWIASQQMDHKKQYTCALDIADSCLTLLNEVEDEIEEDDECMVFTMHIVTSSMNSEITLFE